MNEDATISSFLKFCFFKNKQKKHLNLRTELLSLLNEVRNWLKKTLPWKLFNFT